MSMETKLWMMFCSIVLGVFLGIPIGGLIEQNHPAKPRAEFEEIMSALEAKVDEMRKLKSAEGQALGGGRIEYRNLPYYGEQVLTNSIPYMPMFPINPFPDVIQMTNGVWRVFPKE